MQTTQAPTPKLRPTVQPSPLAPGKLAAAVLNPTWMEQIDFAIRVGLRYGAQLAFSWIQGWIWAFRNRYKTMSDKDLVFVLFHTAVTRLVSTKLDEVDVKAFAPHLATAPNAQNWKLDHSSIGLAETLPGCYAAPTVLLLEATPDNEPVIKAIKINDLVVTPADPAWELTKLFFMQGLTQHVVTSTHVPVHFPNDAINAITQTHLPKEHLLRRLLTPHFRFSLALSNSALHSKASVLYNNQVFPYSPYAFTAAGLRKMVVASHDGIEGNSSYPRYRFDVKAHEKIISDYGYFLRAYHKVIHKWVKQVVDQMDPADPHVRVWADEISKWVPGFPVSDLLQTREALTDVVAYVVLNITVMHAAEHHDYGRLDQAYFPHRLRVPPPKDKNAGAFVHKNVATRLDAYRHWMAWNMFYRDVTVTRLLDVDYGFADPALREGQKVFLRDLKETDATMPVRKIVRLDVISASIQF